MPAKYRGSLEGLQRPAVTPLLALSTSAAVTPVTPVTPSRGRTVTPRQRSHVPNPLVPFRWDLIGQRGRRLTEGKGDLTNKVLHEVRRAVKPLEEMNDKALRTRIVRARDVFLSIRPEYDSWTSWLQSCDRSYDREKARDLVDDLLSVGSLDLVSAMFAYRQQAVCWDRNLRRHVRWLERELERMRESPHYRPNLTRPLLPDRDAERLRSELGSGPQPRKHLAQKFGKTDSAMTAVRRRMGAEIINIRCNGVDMWALAGTQQAFVPTRELVLKALNQGVKPTTAAMVKATGRTSSAVKRVLGLLRAEGKVQARVRPVDKIVAALTPDKEKTLAELGEDTGESRWVILRTVHQHLKGEVIRTRRGNRTGPARYALAGTCRAESDIGDAILALLRRRRRPMTFGEIISGVERSLTGVSKALRQLRQAGEINHEPRGLYRLVP